MQSEANMKMHTVLLVVGMFAISCGGDDAGGDGGGGVDAAIGGCSPSADSCTGDSICIAGRCEAAFGRLYAVTSVAISLPTTDPEGAAWDAGGGAPDIFFELFVNGASAGRSATTQDRFSAAFPGPYTVQPVGGGPFEVRVFDEDLTVDDLAATCAATPLTADLLRARQLGCGAGVSFRIDPQ